MCSDSRIQVTQSLEKLECFCIPPRTGNRESPGFYYALQCCTRFLCYINSERKKNRDHTKKEELKPYMFATKCNQITSISNSNSKARRQNLSLAGKQRTTVPDFFPERKPEELKLQTESCSRIHSSSLQGSHEFYFLGFYFSGILMHTLPP